MTITAAASTAGASAVSLVDDDGGVALFSAAALSPGRVQAACVGLTASGSVDPATEVSLSADVLPAGLAPYLQVWVERGSLPDGGSCGDFSGGVVWSGTLDRFPATGTAGIPTGWRPALDQRSVYRFTVSVLDDDRAQDLRTAAAFRWSFTEAAPPAPPAPPPDPVPVPTVAPATSAPPTASAPRSSAVESDAPTTSAAVPAAPTTAPATTTPPTTDPPASGPVPVAEGRPRAVVEAPPIASGPVAALQAAFEAAGEVAQQVGTTAVAVARDGQYPLSLVGVVTAFLFLQGRLDRRDPKLALARVREELSEYRDFPEPPPTETT